jgi:glyoxylase I family protein
MAEVKGVGAVVVYACEPEKLARWYAAHLGVITALDESDGNYYGAIEDGSTASPVRFGIYPAEQGREPTTSSSSIMINYKVASLDEFKSQLSREGVRIERELEAHGSRFLYLRDPEGNRLELWETA